MNATHQNSIYTSSIPFDSDSKNQKSDENHNKQKKKFTLQFQPHFQFEKTQKQFLEYYYTKNQEPKIQKMLHLSKKLNVPLTKIIQWFKKKNLSEFLNNHEKMNGKSNEKENQNKIMDISDEYDKNNNLIQKYQSTDITDQKNKKHNSDQNNNTMLKKERGTKQKNAQTKLQPKSLLRSDIPAVPIKKTIKKSKLKFRDIRNHNVSKKRNNRMSVVLSNFCKKSHKIANFRVVNQSKSQDYNFNIQNNSNSENSLQNEIQSCPLQAQQTEFLQDQKLKNIKNHVIGQQMFQQKSGYQFNNQNQNNSSSQNKFINLLFKELQQLDQLFSNHLMFLECNYFQFKICFVDNILFQILIKRNYTFHCQNYLILFLELRNDQNFLQSLMQKNFQDRDIPQLINLVTELFNMFQKMQDFQNYQENQRQNQFQINQMINFNNNQFRDNYTDQNQSFQNQYQQQQQFEQQQQQQYQQSQQKLMQDNAIMNLIQQIIPNQNYNPNNVLLLQLLKSNSENLNKILNNLYQNFENYFKEIQ